MSAMTRYVVLLRGVNVGGKNKVPMARLRDVLTERGFGDVSTYIASGNVLLRSDRSAARVQQAVEDALVETFDLDDDLIRVLALTEAQLRAVVDDRPDGFGDEPQTYHSDAIFLIGATAEEVMPIFNPRDGVDRVWPGKGLVYSQRLSAERTKSRLSVIAGTPAYKSMTIRSWQTTLKLLALLDG
jgi:uncharacterized protein (DUF1697 family)